ncbi:hypothetical protein OIU76_012513 [Salix suchowensis]|nr:hypothetical protein OIU76_012513 [Salix suchowensis]
MFIMYGANLFIEVCTLFSFNFPSRRSWLHFQLDLLCSWFTWPPSPSLELASTLLGVWELLLSTTKTRPGMTNGSSGLDPSSVQPLQLSTTNSS